MNEHFHEVLNHYAKRVGVFDLWNTYKELIAPSNMKTILEVTSTLSPEELKERFQKFPFLMAIDISSGEIYKIRDELAFWITAKWMVKVLTTNAQEYIVCGSGTAQYAVKQYFRNHYVSTSTRAHVMWTIKNLGESVAFYIIIGDPINPLIYVVNKE